MAKTLVKALENGKYTGSIVGCTTSVEILGSRQTFDLFNEDSKKAFEELNVPVEFYTLKIQLSDRVLTTNKFANKTIWTDSNGEGWTACDFFTSGIQRQRGMEDVTDDIEIFKNATNIDLYIEQYTNPKTGKNSYNVSSTQPKGWELEHDLGLAF